MVSSLKEYKHHQSKTATKNTTTSISEVNEYREQFSLNPRVAYLNHGSFGSVPKVVAEAQREIQALEESNPNLFFRSTLPKLHEEASTFVQSEE